MSKERDTLELIAHPVMEDGYRYIAIWDADNHGTCYPMIIEKQKTFKRVLVESVVVKHENDPVH